MTCRNNLELGTISPHFDENSRVSHNSLLDLRLQPYKSNETQNYRRSSIESLLEEREPSPFKQQLAQSNRGPPPGLGPDPVIQKEKLPAQKQALATKKTEYKQQPQGNLPEKQTINQQQQQQYYQQPQPQTKPRTPAQKTETANSKLPQAQPANLKSAENFVVVSEPKKNEKANLKTPSSLVEEEKVESFVKPKEQFQGKLFKNISSFAHPQSSLLSTDRKKPAKGEEKPKSKIPNFENIFERFSNGYSQGRKSVGEAVNEDADSKNELKGQAKSTDEPTADRQQTTSQQRQEATSTAAGGTQIQSNQTPLVQGQEEPTKSPKKKKKPKKKKNQTEAAKEDVNDQETNKSLIKPESVVSTEEDIKELSFSDLEKIANVRQTVVDEEEIELTQSVKCRYTDMTYGFEELGNRYNVLKDNLIICDNFFAQNYLPQGSENTILSLNSVNEEPVEGGTKKKNKKRKRNKKKKSKKIEEVQGFTVEGLQAAAYTGQNPNIYAENYNFYFSK